MPAMILKGLHIKMSIILILFNLGRVLLLSVSSHLFFFCKANAIGSVKNKKFMGKFLGVVILPPAIPLGLAKYDFATYPSKGKPKRMEL